MLKLVSEIQILNSDCLYRWEPRNKKLLHAEFTTLVRAPLDLTYRLNAEYRNLPRVFPRVRTILSVKETYGETRLEAVDEKGRRFTVVQRTRPLDRVVREVKTKDEVDKVSFTLGQAPEGTRVAATLDMELKGLFAISTPFLGQYACERLVSLYIEPLKTVAEAEGAGQGGDGLVTV